jgi:hypothetical protein
LSAPILFRTYKARPTYSVWLPLIAEDREDLASWLARRDFCRRPTRNIYVDGVCQNEKEKFELGGEYKYYSDSTKYFAINAAVAVMAFVVVFALALLIPLLAGAFTLLIRRYWKWLNA